MKEASSGGEFEERYAENMAKVFNVTADCKPDKHYIVKLDTRIAEIKALVDGGAYFTINRARQYGKTTTLRALGKYLKEEYYVVLLDFQTISHSKFANENAFSLAFSKKFLRELKNKIEAEADIQQAIAVLDAQVAQSRPELELTELFESLSDICAAADKPIVLMIDEVDSATNNQVFLDFLAQLRAGYIDRDEQATFQSVILAGVHDVKNLQRKLRPEEEHKINSPWNIAADFKVDMSFAQVEIAKMLQEYEADHHTGMNVEQIAQLIYDYTSGYPFLVSRLCKLLDEDVCEKEGFKEPGEAWTRDGVSEAVKMLLNEKNTLFESLSGKLVMHPDLGDMLQELLFAGKKIAYNFYETAVNVATMYGFVKDDNGTMVVSNRIFETWLYNYYLSTAEVQKKDIYVSALQDKNQFVVGGHLNVRRILERFVVHFNDLYGDRSETFIEEEGRKYFLLYLRPIINGVGNYYIEARTREMRRTDIIIDYLGEQFVIEMKIWHGNEYHNRGERQLIGYLEDYHLDTGYMVSFNFNENKEIGVREISIGDKKLIEAVV